MRDVNYQVKKNAGSIGASAWRALVQLSDDGITVSVCADGGCPATANAALQSKLERVRSALDAATSQVRQ